jgi:hypothetical protein
MVVALSLDGGIVISSGARNLARFTEVEMSHCVRHDTGRDFAAAVPGNGGGVDKIVERF